MSLHSSIIGGSTAARLLACPGSHQAQLALPATADAPSEYANEGTAMHEVMTGLMLVRKIDPKVDLFQVSENYLGDKFYDRILTDEHLSTMIWPALGALEDVEKIYGEKFKVAGVEQRVLFPGVPGAFGTCDVILQSPTMVLHIDWKFGQGVGVKAVYSDNVGDYVNAQLAFYTTAAMATLPELYTGRTLAAAIIQPRGTEPLTHTAIDREELHTFREDVEQAVILAMGRKPPISKGEHCRFAPCKALCPLWTGPLIDLSMLKPVVKRTPPPNREVTPYAEYLSKAKVLCDHLAMIKNEIDEQLHAYLENGGVVPGWRLKAKVKMRQWIEPAVVEKALKKLGFKKDEIWQSKLVTFAAADATAKRKRKTIPEHLRVAPPTNETTVAPTSDPAPVIERALVLEQFRAALTELKTARTPAALGAKQETGR